MDLFLGMLRQMSTDQLSSHVWDHLAGKASSDSPFAHLSRIIDGPIAKPQLVSLSFLIAELGDELQQELLSIFNSIVNERGLGYPSACRRLIRSEQQPKKAGRKRR